MKHTVALVLAFTLLLGYGGCRPDRKDLMGSVVKAAGPYKVYLPFVAKNYSDKRVVLALDDDTPGGYSCWQSGTGQQNALIFPLAEPILVDAILMKAPKWADRTWYIGRAHIYQVHSVDPLLLTELWSTEENTLSGEFYPVDQFYPFPIVPPLKVSGVIMVAIENTVPLEGYLAPCLEFDNQTGILANTHWTMEDGVWREHYSLEPAERRELGYPKVRVRGRRGGD